MPLIGFVKSIHTIMMLKICSELPDMYIMMAFIGSCLAGASASSQAFFSFSVSVSSADGLARGGRFCVDRCRRREVISHVRGELPRARGPAHLAVTRPRGMRVPRWVWDATGLRPCRWGIVEILHPGRLTALRTRPSHGHRLDT